MTQSMMKDKGARQFAPFVVAASPKHQVLRLNQRLLVEEARYEDDGSGGREPHWEGIGVYWCRLTDAGKNTKVVGQQLCIKKKLIAILRRSDAEKVRAKLHDLRLSILGEYTRFFVIESADIDSEQRYAFLYLSETI